MPATPAVTPLPPPLFHLLLAGLLAWCLPAAAGTGLEIAVRTTEPGVYATTRDPGAVRLQVLEGQPARLVLLRDPATQEWLVAISPLGAAARPAVRSAEVLALRLTARRVDGHIRLALSASRRDASGAGSTFDTTVRIPPDRWIRVLDPGGSEGPEVFGRRYGTRRATGAPLWVRITEIR